MRTNWIGDAQKRIPPSERRNFKVPLLDKRMEFAQSPSCAELHRSRWLSNSEIITKRWEFPRLRATTRFAKLFGNSRANTIRMSTKTKRRRRKNSNSLTKPTKSWEILRSAKSTTSSARIGTSRADFNHHQGGT